jgi:hypothetical protein
MTARLLESIPDPTRTTTPFRVAAVTGPLFREEKSKIEAVGSGQNALMGRPRLLTEAMTEEIARHVELGGSLRGAAARAGCSHRSLRRWLAEGTREVAALSPEALLALRLGRAEQQARALDWRRTARMLEELAGEPFDIGY